MKKILAIILIQFAALSVCYGEQAVISGKLPFLRGTDSVHVTVSKYGCFAGVRQFNKVYSAKIDGDSFRLEIPATRTPQFIFLDFSRLDKNINKLLIEPGDNVYMEEKDGKYVFSGTHADKYNMVIGLDGLYRRFHHSMNISDPAMAAPLFLRDDSTATEQLNYLERRRSNVSSAAYLLLKSNILSNDLFKGSGLVYLDPESNAGKARASLKGYVKNDSLENLMSELRTDTLAIYNQFFLRGEVLAYRRDSCFLQGKPFNAKGCYEYLERYFNGREREALLTWLIYNRKDQPEDLKPFIDNALQLVREPDFRELLFELSSARLQGTRAFDFELPDEHGKLWHFTDFKGKVVFLDFWYTGCQSCAETAPILRKVEEKLKTKNIIFITICTDKDHARWLKSLTRKLYTSDQSINLYTRGNGNFDSVVSFYKISEYPTLIVIDKNGRLLSPPADPRLDGGARLVALLTSAL